MEKLEKMIELKIIQKIEMECVSVYILTLPHWKWVIAIAIYLLMILF